VLAVTVVAFIASLKIAVTCDVLGAAAPAAGLMLVTVGGMVSGAATDVANTTSTQQFVAL